MYDINNTNEFVIGDIIKTTNDEGFTAYGVITKMHTSTMPIEAIVLSPIGSPRHFTARFEPNSISYVNSTEYVNIEVSARELLITISKSIKSGNVEYSQILDAYNTFISHIMYVSDDDESVNALENFFDMLKG